jgi:hypothetical protein
MENQTEEPKLVKRRILKQVYEVSNSFDDKAVIIALQSQLGDKIFKELINGEKHSLTVTFTIDVNEKEEEPETDQEKIKMREIIDRLQKVPSETIKQLGDIDLLLARIDSYRIEGK